MELLTFSQRLVAAAAAYPAVLDEPLDAVSTGFAAAPIPDLGDSAAGTFSTLLSISEENASSGSTRPADDHRHMNAIGGHCGGGGGGPPANDHT